MVIRSMKREDIFTLSKAFIDQGWSGRQTVLEEYFEEQKTNKRYMFIAESEYEVIGYVSVIPEAVSGPILRLKTLMFLRSIKIKESVLSCLLLQKKKRDHFLQSSL